eukprot:scaffold132027_cov17-Tisochrysis_lutea.AAC.1
MQHPLQELLKNVVCGDEVPRGKPAPDTFLAAAKLLGSPPPEQCLVLEDSPAGAQVGNLAFEILACKVVRELFPSSSAWCWRTRRSRTSERARLCSSSTRRPCVTLRKRYCPGCNRRQPVALHSCCTLSQSGAWCWRTRLQAH